MFESLSATNVRSAGKRVLALLFSLFAHALMILLLVVLPLVHFHVLPQTELLTLLVAAPPPPPAPAPPPPISPDRPAATHPPLIHEVAWTVPDRLPVGIPAPNEEPPQIGVVPGISSVGLGVTPGSGLVGNGPPGSLVGLMPPTPPPPPPPAPKRKPLPRGGDVQASKLIRKVVPIYPPLALRARVEGTVILEINVDEEGNVTEVRVLRGHPLLEDEAVRAVKQWKYSPTLLNGEPIPILSTVTVEFRLKR